jgi:hypothetical protein
MKKKVVALMPVLLLVTSFTYAQEFGLSFSYFIPKNGYFSTPVSPFSIRGVGFNLTDFLALESGASLYRMSGLNLKDLPFESKDPLIGPNFTLFIPAELVIMLKAGNYGNFDRAIRAHEGWDVANSDFSFENNPGFGYHAGAELTLPITGQIGISFETNYLVGQAKFPVKGNYIGGDTAGPLETVDVDYKDAKVDFTGLEFSISLLFDAGGGPSAGKKSNKKRR